jgi:predicted RNA-binding protein with PUA-like domain
VVKSGYPDHNAFDPKHPYYDPKSDPDNPRWFMVDVAYMDTFPHFISLKSLQQLVKDDPQHPLKDMFLLNRGRLSVQPVREFEFQHILGMSGSTINSGEE